MNVNLRNRDRAFIQGGELLIRPKNSGAGYHYGTGITGGYVAHITPEEGKHVDAGEEFCTPWCIRVRFERSDVENYIVEERALADLGDGYNHLTANCEHDVTYAQTGIAQSPSVSNYLIGALGLGILALVGLASAKN